MAGSFVFERDEQIGGFFTTDDFAFTSSWYDPLTGKLYVTAGTAGDIYEWDNLSQPPQMVEWKSKVIITKDMINLGAARVVADYAADIHLILWEAATTVWDTTTYTWDSANPVTFKLYADKELILTTDLTDSGTFRLPTGYRTDTYEVSVSGDVRIRAIHLAETPLGLKEV